jgi:CheY-like chemotaxis protein
MTGANALEVAAKFRPHLVLMDIGLPGMDSYEVARRMRADANFEGVTLCPHRIHSGRGRPATPPGGVQPPLRQAGQRDRTDRAAEFGRESCHVARPISNLLEEIVGPGRMPTMPPPYSFVSRSG